MPRPDPRCASKNRIHDEPLEQLGGVYCGYTADDDEFYARYPDAAPHCMAIDKASLICLSQAQLKWFAPLVGLV